MAHLLISRRWQQHWLFSALPPASPSIPHCLPPGSPQPPHLCPTRLLFASPAENSLSLRVYLSGDCLTTNTSFVPFLSLDNLGFMQGCGSRKIQIQAEHSVRWWLRQAVFTHSSISSSRSLHLYRSREKCVFLWTQHSSATFLFAASSFVWQAVNRNGWVVHFAGSKALQLLSLLPHPSTWISFRALRTTDDKAIDERPLQVPRCYWRGISCKPLEHKQEIVLEQITWAGASMGNCSGLVSVAKLVCKAIAVVRGLTVPVGCHSTLSQGEAMLYGKKTVKSTASIFAVQDFWGWWAVGGWHYFSPALSMPCP